MPNDKKINDELILAAAYGDLKKVKAALSSGANINAVDSDGCTPALRAAIRGDIEMYDYLAGQKGFKNVSDKYGNDAAILAVIFGHVKMYDHLMDNHGFDPKAVDLQGNNALIKAVSALKSASFREDIAILKHLLSKYPMPLDKKNKYGNTAEDEARMAGKGEVGMFLNQAAMSNYVLKDELKRWYSPREKFAKIKQMCEHQGLIPQSFKPSLTEIAAVEGNIELYDYLISQHGFKVKTSDIVAAVKAGKDEFVINAVTKYKPNVDFAEKGGVSISQALNSVADEANIDFDEDYEIPTAESSASRKLAKDLVEKLSKENQRLMEKHQHLINQARNGASFAELLSAIDDGVPFDEVDSDGCNIALIAALNGDIPLYDSLIKKYPELKSSKDKFGNNALILSASKGHTQMFDHLLDVHNFDPNTFNHNGYDAFKMAALQNEVKMVDHFLKRYPQSLFDYFELNSAMAVDGSVNIYTAKVGAEQSKIFKELKDNGCDEVDKYLRDKIEKTSLLVSAVRDPFTFQKLCKDGALPQAFSGKYHKYIIPEGVKKIFPLARETLKDPECDLNLGLKTFISMIEGATENYSYLVNNYEEFKIESFDLFLAVYFKNQDLCDRILDNYQNISITAKSLESLITIATMLGDEASAKKMLTTATKSYYTEEELVGCITSNPNNPILRTWTRRDDPIVYYTFQQPPHPAHVTEGKFSDNEKEIFREIIGSETSKLIVPIQEISFTKEELANMDQISKTKNIIFVTKGKPFCASKGDDAGASSIINDKYRIMNFPDNVIARRYVTHELGHILDLKHPAQYEKPDHAPFCDKATTHDTIMSYETPDALVPKHLRNKDFTSEPELGFKPADIKAINKAWAEKNPELIDSCLNLPKPPYYELDNQKNSLPRTDYGDSLNVAPLYDFRKNNQNIAEAISKINQADRSHVDKTMMNIAGGVLMALSFLAVVKKFLRPNVKAEVRDSAASKLSPLETAAQLD